MTKDLPPPTNLESAPTIVKDNPSVKRRLNLDPPSNPTPAITIPAPDEQGNQELIIKIVELCREITLPLFTDHNTEIIANKFNTLINPDVPITACYCSEPSLPPLNLPE